MKTPRKQHLIWVGILLTIGCTSTPDRLDVENRAWREALAAWNAEAVEHFAETYPESYHVPEARERAAFHRARDDGSVEALESYLREYPEGRFVDELERDLERELLRLSYRDPDAGEAYLKRFPSGRNSASVRDRLPGQYFDQTRKTGTPEAFAAFAERFPRHEFADEARRIQQELTDEARRLQQEKECEQRGLAALAAARTARLSVEYRPRADGDGEEHPPWLEEGFVGPASTFLRLAGLREVGEEPADVEVRVSARAYGIAEMYGKERILVFNAGLELKTELEVRAGEDAIVRREAVARDEPPVSMVFAEVDGKPPARNQSRPDEPGLSSLARRVDTVGRLAEVLALARGTDLLLAGLRDDSAKVWRPAQSALKGMAREETLPALRELLHGDELRFQPRAVGALEGWWAPAAKADEEERLAFYLFRSREPYGPAEFTPRSLPLATALVRGEPGPGWTRAVDVLASIGAPAAPALIEGLEAAREVEDRRRTIAAALLLVGEPAVEPLIGALDHEHPEVRESAAFALGLMWTPDARTALEDAAEDPDAGVRAAAATALERLDVDPVLERLESPDAEVRFLACYELRHVKDPRAVAACKRALHDESTRVRREAVRALRWTGDPTAVEDLIGALADPAASVRYTAAVALGSLEDVRALEPLIALLADEDSQVRRGAAWALGQLGDPRALEPLRALTGDEDGDVRADAVEAIERLDPDRTVGDG